MISREKLLSVTIQGFIKHLYSYERIGGNYSKIEEKSYF